MYDVLGIGPKAPQLAQPTEHKAELFKRWLDQKLMAGVVGHDDALHRASQGDLFENGNGRCLLHARLAFGRELARRSFWAAIRNRSVSTAGCCRSFRRSAGRLLRWARLPHLSQSGGGQAGARSLRSPSSRRAAVAPGRGPARRVICVYVDGQAHDPVKRTPALVASWCAITRARNLLARRNVSLGRRLIAASPPKRAAIKKMSAAR
jgi:hypothetical protein